MGAKRNRHPLTRTTAAVCKTITRAYYAQSGGNSSPAGGLSDEVCYYQFSPRNLEIPARTPRSRMRSDRAADRRRYGRRWTGGSGHHRTARRQRPRRTCFCGHVDQPPGDHPFSDLKLVLRGPEAPAFVHLLLCTLDVMERPSGVRRAELDFGHLSATAVWQGDEAAIKIAGLSATEGDLRLTIQRREGVQQVVETLRELVEDSMSLPLTRQLRDS